MTLAEEEARLECKLAESYEDSPLGVAKRELRLADQWAKRLEAAGAVTLGKVNLDEFTFGSSNESTAFRPPRGNGYAGRHGPARPLPVRQDTKHRPGHRGGRPGGGQR